MLNDAIMNTAENILDHQKACDISRERLISQDIIGPWLAVEPDRIQFKHLGLNCLLLRNPILFNWCGYVGVPPDHPLYGVAGDRLKDFKVHGGITFHDHCHSYFCHVPEKGEPENLYWLGFDCGHWDDLMPGMQVHSFQTYRDVQFVTKETKRLAAQLA